MAKRCGISKPCHGMKGGLLSPFFQNGADSSGYGLGPTSASSGGSGSFTEPTPPASDVILKFNLFELSSMFQERSVFSGGVPVTAVVNTTDPVGTIFDQSLSTTYFRATGATAIPTLGSDGILFDTNDQLEVPGSNVSLKAMHAVGATYGVKCKLKKGVDGSAGIIMGTQGLSGTHFGWVLNQTATNKLQFFASGGTGQSIANYTSTKSFLIADGVVSVQINIAAGANASSIRIGGTTETFTADLTKGATNNCTNNLFAGGTGSFFRGQICESIEIVNGRVWTSNEMTAYDAQTTARTSNDFTPVKQWYLDFNDTSYIYSDSGETTPIADGGFVRSIRNKITSPSISSFSIRKATSSSDAASPLWRLSQQNSKSTIQFDGTGNQFLTYSEDLWIEVAGVSTFIIVLKNTDSTFGSHYINGNPEYGTITGKNYSGNAAATGDAAQPYSILHHNGSGGGGTGPLCLTSRSDGYNIIVIRRKGGVCDIFSQNKVKNTLSNFGKFTSSLIGKAAPAGAVQWETDGYVALIEKYMGFLSDAQVESKIDSLKTLYSISGTL